MHTQTFARLKKYAATVKLFVTKNKYNDRYCFLIDMKLPSGYKRFFIYDLKCDSIVSAGMVTHGIGNNRFDDTITFSNKPGSNCTSLGKYRIGKSYYGKFGLAYKLYGVEKTNSEAYNRNVVLHAHPYVPDTSVAPLKICRSWGCPTVSPAFLNQLKTYLNQPGEPMLLSIFY
ncbi:MAG: murein L,D-transpeptidase catalytic domain-containing protein [Ferruginibacter sp.]